jgi:hypothetical protein
MNTLSVLKKMAAVIFLVCFFLPLSRCSKHEVEHDPNDPNALIVVGTKYSYMVPVNEIEAKSPSSLFYILPFVWPLPLWLLQKKIEPMWVKVSVGVIEVLSLCSATYCIVLWSIFFGETLIGGYLALICVAIMWVAFLSPKVKAVYLFARNRREFNH